jgi:serine/threonine protein kinase/predicted negative regulator of RcsB-dependent stress response
MSISRWQTVSQIFEAALDLPAHERDDFVREACEGNSEVEAEVIRLIAADEQACGFLERPALSTLSAQARFAAPPLLPAGSIVASRFKIVRFIGQGGMGQVYEALDLELNSRIALKAIRPEIAVDQRMLSRFRREVQLTRMITHPSVCRTFDIEHHASTSGDSASDGSGDVTFLTMELLEGETLSAHLRRTGRFTPAESLPLALQMIDALAAAHGVGVIHRDFKPSNVLLVPIAARSSSSSNLIAARDSSAATSSGSPSLGSSPSGSSPSGSSPSGSKSSASACTLRVVVTDFGLARAVATHAGNDANDSGPVSMPSSLTGDQALMGTLVYMAPEQFERGEASVGSDIYSLGLVLFEMITGQRPFADDLAFAEAAKRLKQPAPSAATLVPGLDPAWDATIARCLAINPKDRFANVRHVAEALTSPVAAVGMSAAGKHAAGTAAAVPTADAGASLAHASPAATTTSSTRPSASRRKYFAVAAITLVLVSLSALVFRHYWMKAEEAKLAEGSTVFLTNIHNGTGDMRFDNTTELVRYQLLQSPYFSLMDSERVRNTLTQMTKPADAELDPHTAREVAMRNGVRRVVFGTLSRVGDSYVLDLDIEQPDNNPLRFRQQWENHWSWNADGGASQPGSDRGSDRGSNKDMPSGFLEAVRNSSDWIRHEIGESANDVARIDAPPEDVTTSNWEALSEFTQAEKFRAARNDDAAVAALRNAAAADPNFALAYARLGDILVSLSRFTEGYAAYDKALAIGDQRLTRRERDRVRGIYASDTWDYAKAEEIFRDYATYYPNDYLGWFYRGTPLIMMGHVGEATSSLRRAEQIDPSKQFAHALIARLDLMSGRYEDASKEILRIRNGGHQDTAGLIEGELNFLRGRHEEARDDFAALKDSQDPQFRSYSYSILARLFAEQGHYASALQFLEQGIAKDLESGDSGSRADKILDRAYIKFKQGQYEACLQDTKLALELDNSLQRSLSAGTTLGQAANAAAGDVRARLASQLQDIENNLPPGDLKPLSEIVRFHLRGEAFLAEGNWQSALQEFENADHLEPPVMDKEYLGRGLLAAAEHTPDPIEAARLKEESVTAYSNLVLRNAQVWQWPFVYPPGYQTDATFSFVKAVVRLGKADQRALDFLSAYMKYRGTADERLPDVEAARRLQALPMFTNTN